MMKPVLIVIITKDVVEPDCMDSILRQDYFNYSTMIHIEKPQIQSDHYPTDVYTNCSHNRNSARRLALAAPVDHFLFIDSDIVLPSHGLSSLMKHGKDVIGGWYSIRGHHSFVGGRWVADEVFQRYYIPEVSVISTDVVGMGCALIHRRVLEQISFESGLDRFTNTTEETRIIMGECGMFGLRCFEKNIPMYLDGDVICGHVERQKVTPIKGKTRGKARHRNTG